eukprot:35314-Chlamydomonas_euryale.AAC.1
MEGVGWMGENVRPYGQHLADLKRACVRGARSVTAAVGVAGCHVARARAMCSSKTQSTSPNSGGALRGHSGGTLGALW